jgi:beta-lactamase class D
MPAKASSHRSILAALAAVMVTGACARDASPPRNAPAPVDTRTPFRVVADPMLTAALDQQQMRGTIAVLHEGTNEVRCANVGVCGQRFIPASTFKIANSLIGLETGVIPDADFVIPWDGVTRDIAAWNRDHSLRSAIAASCVPYYQELARRVGRERMEEWLERLGYGNRRVGAQVDAFWLRGPLEISPLEQLAFLSALARGELPVSERTLGIVENILILDHKGEATLRGKTGWALPNTPDELGWFVGWVDRQGARTYIAVLLMPPRVREEVSFIALRRNLAEQVLSQLGVW